jgi:hypothetical protein
MECADHRVMSAFIPPVETIVRISRVSTPRLLYEQADVAGVSPSWTVAVRLSNPSRLRVRVHETLLPHVGERRDAEQGHVAIDFFP